MESYLLISLTEMALLIVLSLMCGGVVYAFHRTQPAWWSSWRRCQTAQKPQSAPITIGQGRPHVHILNRAS